MERQMSFVPLLGRLMIGLPFMMSGLRKLAAYGPTVAGITAVGLPLPPLSYAAAVAIELGGGLLMVLGYRTRLIAAVQVVFVLMTAVFFHARFGDPNQVNHFLKNIMITGGLLQIAYFGAGPWSLDSRFGVRGAAKLAPTV